MGKEFCVLYRWKDGEPTDVPLAVVLAEDEAVTFTAKSGDLPDSLADYFKMSRSWTDRHAKSEFPLSSLFGKNAYMSGDYTPYNKDTKGKYERAVSAMKGDTTKFVPEKVKRKR